MQCCHHSALDDQLAPVPAAAAAAAAPSSSSSSSSSSANVAASIDFEAGVLFNKADKTRTGVLTADDFRQLWRETKDNQNADNMAGVQRGGGGSGESSGRSSSGGTPWSGMDPAAVSFEAGKIFANFDRDSDGQLNKQEFENLIRSQPELLRRVGDGRGLPPPPGTLPMEVITGRLLTHYDETAGVAIPRTAIDQHRAMGNTVTPLVESYRARYDRLRSALTGRLLPRREHLLQLRRQLQNCSAEVAAAKKGIERETNTDSEQIIERLRAVESMRQSSIKHQILQLEEELEAIERIVRRVEQVGPRSVFFASIGFILFLNDDNSFLLSSSFLLTNI